MGTMIVQLTATDVAMLKSMGIVSGRIWVLATDQDRTVEILGMHKFYDDFVRRGVKEAFLRQPGLAEEQ